MRFMRTVLTYKERNRKEPLVARPSNKRGRPGELHIIIHAIRSIFLTNKIVVLVQRTVSATGQ